MRARGFVHVYQTERSLFTNSCSSMEGHINKVIFSTSTTLTCFEWQLDDVWWPGIGHVLDR